MVLRLGIVLIVGSFVLWLLIPLVPLVGFRGLAAAGAVAGLLVAAEVVFWIGVLLAGRDTWRLARTHGWRGVPGALWRMFRGADPAAGPTPPAAH
ncbi:MAG: transporter suffix domain-containing protein [Pseudonocardia sp.]